MEQFNCLLEMKDKGIIARQYIYEVGGYRYNWHKDVEIMFILSGKVEVCVEGSVYNLEEGDLMVINSNVGHASLKKDDHSIVMVLHINPIYFDLFCHEYDIVKFDCNTAYKNKDDLEFKEIKQILSSMMFSMLENNKGSKFESLGHLSMLTNHLFKYFYKDENNNANLQKHKKHQDRLKIAMDYIEDNYREKISLDDIAKLINYNSSYTSSFFKNYVGVNFYEYLLRVRLQGAVNELITTNKTIYNIALDNGFSDVKAFNFSFKKNFNKSPSEYRIANSENSPILSLDERDFLNIDNEFIKEKLNKYLNNDKYGKTYIDKKIENKKEENKFNEIKLICEKNNESDKFMDYLLKSNLRLKLEVVDK